MQKTRPYIASLFLLLSLTLAMPADYWHDCSHGEEMHLAQAADTEFSQEAVDCALCEYVSPDLSLDSFSFSLLGNLQFWHAPIQNQASLQLDSPEHPSLRGPPIG